uniref:Uncharacterized protein n=1 Tax=Eubacterium cellulosolvens (strain ATCC 43171 / JCM 9499 / 6) TaxID=633697 RepID=I5ARE0_EUBC6
MSFYSEVGVRNVFPASLFFDNGVFQVLKAL